MLVDKLFFSSNFYLHWFFSNLSFFERDPHMDSPEGIGVKMAKLACDQLCQRTLRIR